MEITTKVVGTSIFEVVVKSGNACISEDISVNARESGRGIYSIEKSNIDQFINAAHEMHRFNGKSDVDFVMGVIEAFLNETEVQELIETL